MGASQRPKVDLTRLELFLSEKTFAWRPAGHLLYLDNSRLFQIPSEDSSGAEIPQWKREMMAKKAADKAKDAALRERIEMEEARKVDAMPEWKRHLLEKRAVAERADSKR